MEIHKVSRGHYDVSINGNRYELDRDAYGLWIVWEVMPHSREYMQDYATKREAINAILEANHA